nr:hypothetical protein [Candidatus Njordarchaeota archaeon]
MYRWVKHIFTLLIALGLYYAVTYLVIVGTINSPSVSEAIITAGSTPAEQIATSFQALFPVPFLLVIVGIVLSKWIQF